MDTQEIDGIVGIALYTLLLLLTLGAFLWSLLWLRSWFELSFQTVFYSFLLSFICVRLVWLIIGTYEDSDTAITFVLNRLAFCLYFTSFLLVLFYWMETYHRNYIDTEGAAFLPRLRWVFVITVVVIYLFQATILIIFLVNGGKREGDLIYDINIITDACLILGYAVLFLIYGLRLLVERRAQAMLLWGDMKEVWKILATTIIFTACFCCRVGMFLYRPLTGNYVQDTLFMFLAYYVPEVVPSALQVYIVKTSKEKVIRDNQFIQDLYANSDDETEGANDQQQPFEGEENYSPSSLFISSSSPVLGNRIFSESSALLHFPHPRTSLY